MALISTPIKPNYFGKTPGEFRHLNAFAALRADGSVVTWGDNTWGGDSSAVASALNGSNDVVEIFSSFGAFAALRADGSVVTWGRNTLGGDSSTVTSALNGSNDVVEIFSSYGAFAALRADGSVVAWGDGFKGGNSSAVASALNGNNEVVQISSTYGAFAALRADGSVVTWGNIVYGGDSSTVASALNGSNDVVTIFSAQRTFAALRADGSVVTWGDSRYGGDSSAVASALNGNNEVVKIFSTYYAFAALRADGSVVTWGDSGDGGNSSAVQNELNGSNDVVEIFSTFDAFAALRADGSVVTWGNSTTGGDSSMVASALNGSNDVVQIFSTLGAYAALRADGSVVTWGSSISGGDSKAVASNLDGSTDVITIFSTEAAFAALRTDGSVVTWGIGISSEVASALNGDNDVVDIFSTSSSFAALRADGSVVTWGNNSWGGNSSAVATQLDGTIDVVSMANPFADDEYRADIDIPSDNVAPTLLASSPTDEALNVSINSDILFTFNEGIIRGTGNILIKNAAGTIIATYDAATSGNLMISGSTLTLNPNTNLAYSTGYKIEFDAGSIKDLAGNNYAGTTSYNFTTSASPSQPPSPLAGASFTWVGASGNTYGLYKTANTWTEANSIAQSVGGYLAHAENEAENAEIYAGVMANMTSTELVSSTANDGGGTAYVWLGASDASMEGSWLWSNDSSPLSTARTEWGSGAMGSEPDNYQDQDYLALGLTNWPSGASAGAGFGNAGEWNDLAGTNRLFFVVEKNAQPSDTTAPTVTTFTPADEASSVAVNSNIVLNFNEVIARGTGNIVLKTSAGTTVASYDAASSNISIAGSTLTLNPSADLAAGTAYTVEFATGSVKDLAGNNFAGTISYNFTTASGTVTPPPTLSKDAQFLVLQPSSPSIVGAGIGDDTYLISGSMIPAGKSITISDASGVNSIQLAPGLSITASQVTSSALKMTLNTGSTVTVLGANAFTYELGGNSSAGLNATDVSYASFVASALGTSIPTTGIALGGSLVVGGVSPATLLASGTAGNDFVIPQYASPSIVGAGAGDDTYLISSALLPAGTALTISDATGSNSIQLAPGLSIASSQVAASALKLTLNTGATVTILGANNFTYDVGGNTTAGIDQADVSFATLVQNTLGTTVPSTGTTNGGAVVIGSASPTGTPVQGNNTVNATAANDVFFFDAVTALLDAAGGNTQAIISGFSTSADKLQINLPTANAAITTLSQLNGQQGVTAQHDPFTGNMLISFGSDANGGQVVSLTLIGVTDAGLVSLLVV